MTVIADPVACSETLAVLAQIERGEVTVTPDERHWCYADLDFTASNGWRFTIFCDGGWDYVDKAVRPDGYVVDAFAMPLDFPDDDEEGIAAAIASPINHLRCYRPTSEVSRPIWGFVCE